MENTKVDVGRDYLKRHEFIGETEILSEDMLKGAIVAIAHVGTATAVKALEILREDIDKGSTCNKFLDYAIEECKGWAE